ncbi:MAG: protein kinase [Acidobacteria bacterium]|nr:protein kinase [Acidobacteriota bacterium]
MKSCPVCQRTYENIMFFCVYDGQPLTESLSENDSLLEKIIDNKYSIDYKIAEGGTGTVYRATHLQLQSPIAIKIMHKALANDGVAIERFRREAYAAMKVRHPNAVAVLDFGITSDRLIYVVMELLVGQSLYEKLRSRHHFSVEEANHLMQQVCAAVSVAHNRGIIHRDLKPENIFLHQEDGQEIVKVLDFGIAKVYDLNFTEENMGQLTGGDAVVGTPFYISPEQCSGQPVDARSDVYSLGIMLYQLLTGEIPFDGPSPIIVLLKQLNERPRPIHEIRPEIPKIINAVVMHALEKDPRSRPASASSFAQEFDVASRALREQEFKDIFLQATDKDLDAAILLAMNDSRQSMSNSLTSEEQEMDIRNIETSSIRSSRTDGHTVLDPEKFSTPEPQQSGKLTIKSGYLNNKRVQGHLSWFDLASVIHLLIGLQETGLLTLHNTEAPPEAEQDVSNSRAFASLYLDQGNITHVRLGVRHGVEAFYQLFQMPLEGCFLFRQCLLPIELERLEPITEEAPYLLKEALGLKTLLSRFVLKFPNLLTNFRRRFEQISWRDEETLALAEHIWEMLDQPAITINELLARSPCCNAKTYQVLATLLATRQISSTKTANLNENRVTDAMPELNE